MTEGKELERMQEAERGRCRGEGRKDEEGGAEGEDRSGSKSPSLGPQGSLRLGMGSDRR